MGVLIFSSLCYFAEKDQNSEQFSRYEVQYDAERNYTTYQPDAGDT